MAEGGQKTPVYEDVNEKMNNKEDLTNSTSPKKKKDPLSKFWGCQLFEVINQGLTLYSPADTTVNLEQGCKFSLMLRSSDKVGHNKRAQPVQDNLRDLISHCRRRTKKNAGGTKTFE